MVWKKWELHQIKYQDSYFYQRDFASNQTIGRRCTVNIPVPTRPTKVQGQTLTNIYPIAKGYLTHWLQTVHVLPLVMLKCLFPFSVHLKLELLTLFPASNNEIYLYLWHIEISHIQLSNPYNAGIEFSRQNLTSVDVRFWRLKSIPAL